jgi:hypothetical protein
MTDAHDFCESAPSPRNISTQWLFGRIKALPARSNTASAGFNVLIQPKQEHFLAGKKGIAEILSGAILG